MVMGVGMGESTDREGGRFLNLTENRHPPCSVNTHIPTEKNHFFARCQQETPLYSLTCTANSSNCIQLCWLPFQTYYTYHEWQRNVNIRTNHFVSYTLCYENFTFVHNFLSPGAVWEGKGVRISCPTLSISSKTNRSPRNSLEVCTN
jgi:hypothetical protein